MAGDLKAGTVLGKCEVLGILGRGGMGAVYRARHRSLDIEVAVKVISMGAAAGAEQREMRERFIREARAAARIRHDNAVQVFDVDEQDGLDYMVMELIQGESAKARLRRSPLTPGQAARIAQEAARALALAHRQGIVHRDVKPENILLTEDGRVKVSDFGLAAWRNDDHGLTRSGQILGTPYYMAPEQIASSAVDGRADIYALGASLYHMIAGRVPFTGDSAIQVCMAHLNEPVPPLRHKRADCPEALEQLVIQMMAKHPDGRPQTCEEVIAALEPFARDAETLAGGEAALRVAVAVIAPSGGAPSDAEATVVAHRGEPSGFEVDPDKTIGSGGVASASDGPRPASVSSAMTGVDLATPSPSNAVAKAPPQASLPPSPASTPAPASASGAAAARPAMRSWGPLSLVALAVVAGVAGVLASRTWAPGKPDGASQGERAGDGVVATSTVATTNATTKNATTENATSTSTSTALAPDAPPAYRAPSAEAIALAARLQELTRKAIESEQRRDIDGALAIYRSIAMTASTSDELVVTASAITALQMGIGALERNGRFREALDLARELERDHGQVAILRMQLSEEDARERIARLERLSAASDEQVDAVRYVVEWGGESLSLADIDGDGRPDVVLCGRPTQYLASASGSLRQVASLRGVDPSDFRTALGVVDADGADPRELVVLPEDARRAGGAYGLLTFPRRNEHALLRWIEARPTGSGSDSERASRCHAADLDGDGVPDLVLSNDDWTWLAVRFGGPRFPGTREAQLTLPGKVVRVEIARRAAAGGRDAALALVEVTERSGRTSYQLHAVTGGGARGPLAATLVRDDMRGWPELATGDWSGDGVSDVITNPRGTSERALEVLRADGKGGFEAVPGARRLEVPPAIPRVRLGDLDGDGKADIVLWREWPEEPISIFSLLSNGDGSFRNAARTVVADVFNVADLAIGDIDGDGHADIVLFSRQHSEVGALYGDGTGRLLRAPPK